MRRSLIGRRHLLRGAAGGAAVAIALPPLETMLDAGGTAFADGQAIPKRFGSWFWAQGVKADRWTPASTGTAWHASPPPALRPFAEKKLLEYVSVVTNTWVPFKVYAPPHFSNHSTMITASPLRVLSGPNADGNYKTETTGPSVLELVKTALGGRTKFDEVSSIVARAWTPTSSLPGNPISLDHNPEAMFNRLFGAGVSGSSITPAAGLVNARKSLLDAVAADAADVRSRLGASDRRRLDEHLGGVRALEKSLTFTGQSACAVPARPGARPPDQGMREALEEVNAAMSDLIVYALACDLTRYFRIQFMRPQSNVIFWPVGVEREYHEWGHSEPSPQPGVGKCVEFLMKQLAYLVDRLRSVPVGPRTLLDHCCVWGYSEVNDPQKHGLFNVPNLVIGRAGGALRSGVHHDAGGTLVTKDGPNGAAADQGRSAVPGAIHTRLLLTMMRAMGIAAPASAAQRA